MSVSVLNTCFDAVSSIREGSTVLIGGFGEAGSPVELIHALIDHGVRDLTVVNNNAGNGEVGLAALIKNRQVRKMICSFPKSSRSTVFEQLYRSGSIELELVPQGTLAERIRAGGAGIPAFFTATSIGTQLAIGKESRRFKDSRDYVLEFGIQADVALIKCATADEKGNLTFNKTARNFNPIMCTAALETIVQASEIVKAGEIDPECVITPGVFVNKLVHVPSPVSESQLIEDGISYP
ncbi:3-oxoacid CoA-transferase subunit A [Sneathiella chungangensis]|uniref:3-oxoacid CoA-transferase subunit A n=1 Tax=Sneathiella chungangensis TaxID=1418234 RepID=A0A845MJV4_9PROT|nr:3-oxoacid CoA-transferase subunit A [Sneathiella chungangensis]MZR24353.1 3-oxoacid CoA-transferase subunit A [Sneathiella chungangensis]